MRGRRWIALLAAGALALVACDWSQPRFGPGRAGFNPFETVVGAGNVARLAPAWSASLPSRGSDVVVIDGVVIAAVSGVSGGPGSVVARDAATGAPRWSQSYPGAGCRPVGCFSPSVSLAAADGAVYVAITFTTTGGLFSYDADTGTPIRSYTSASTWGPAVADGRLYASVYSGTTGIGAWDVATGTPVFGSNELGGVSSLPVAVGGGRVYDVRNGMLRAFDASGVAGCAGTPAVCTPLWTAPAVGAPAVAGEVVVGRGPGVRGGGLRRCDLCPDLDRRRRRTGVSRCRGRRRALRHVVRPAAGVRRRGVRRPRLSPAVGRR
jgi:hypothetical protein